MKLKNILLYAAYPGVFIGTIIHLIIIEWVYALFDLLDILT